MKVLNVKPTKRTQEWLETVNQIAGLNFRCPHCQTPLTIGVCEILFADKESKMKKKLVCPRCKQRIAYDSGEYPICQNEDCEDYWKAIKPIEETQ
jgi:nitrite reductase/ring-hydroxylating ferredoxin subunit